MKMNTYTFPLKMEVRSYTIVDSVSVHKTCCVTMMSFSLQNPEESEDGMNIDQEVRHFIPAVLVDSAHAVTHLSSGLEALFSEGPPCE